MSDFICAKGLTLGGVTYAPGQDIPAGAVLPSRVRALVRQGYIVAKTEAAPVPAQEPQEPVIVPAPITIPLTKDGGVYEVVAAPEDIITAISVMQLTLEEATKVIETTESEEALILIHALDSRKGVKTAASDRAEALATPNSPGAPESQETPETQEETKGGGGES